MFRLLLMIISYAALILLLMPLTSTGVISAAVVLFLGIGWILYKKAYKIDLWSNKQYYLMLATILVAAYLGWNCYVRGLGSNAIWNLAIVLRMATPQMVCRGSLMLAVLSVYFLYAGLRTAANMFSNGNPQKNLIRDLLSCCIVAVVIVVQAQIMSGVPALSMGFGNFLWGVLIVAVTVLFFYCLLGRMIPAAVIGSVIFMVISTINVYVYSFRKRLFEPVDIFSAGTAMNVLENYSIFPIPEKILVGWGFVAAVLILLSCLQRKSEPRLSVQKCLVLLVVCIIISTAIFFHISNLEIYHWENEGTHFTGYILDFVSKFREITPSKPENYNTELIESLEEQYAAEKNGSATETSQYPHIIVIMDEAFSDLRVAAEFSTNKEVMPFISSLKENTISGYTLASVYAGNTANSEYEFLTGNSMAWLSPNTVPYQQYIRSSTYSMVSHLKSTYHYKCVAMHPYHASGWNRPYAYEHLGFDECYFIDDFPQEHYIRSYISDQEMFEFLIETYETQKEHPLFLFGVTMQNHGGYSSDEGTSTMHITLTNGMDYPRLEQYLSLIHETDKAVEDLITYFQNVNEDVIIVFFGDHQPRMSTEFYETLSGTAENTLDTQQRRYIVPFFIWANYDIEEEYIDCTSLNYLSSYVYDAAGIALPPYNQFLRKMEEDIPSINANGFYSVASGCYLPFDAANEEERRQLELYEALQYNSIFDRKNRSEILFPSLK